MANELPNKPLVEALLELRWTPGEAPPSWTDPAYPLYVGSLFQSIRDEFPFKEDLPSRQIPDEISQGIPKFRFRSSEGGWPLVQVGPGIATVNSTGTYKWEPFRATVLSFLAQLLDAYQTGSDEGPTFSFALLRYINAVRVSPGDDPVAFVQKMLHTHVALPSAVVNAGTVGGSATQLDLRLSYPLNAPEGLGNLRIATGTHNDEPAIVWDISVVTQGSGTPQQVEEIGAWLEEAHETIEAWFLALVEGDLLRTFEGNSDDS